MRPLVVANWKMQLEDAESQALVANLKGVFPKEEGIEVVLCPTFTALCAVRDEIAGSGMALGAQDCAWEREGAYTGEVSPFELADLGCRYVILGHSERRIHLGETDDMVARKAVTAQRAGLVPIVCVGETSEERDRGARNQVLHRQIAAVGARVELGGRCCFAYEPIWAIGTGASAHTDDIASAHAYIVEQLRALDGGTRSTEVRLLYGGSVDEQNVKSVLSVPHVHGVLVGTASQTVERFRGLIAAAAS
jgi:triosephosphate isomerase (TIM)